MDKWREYSDVMSEAGKLEGILLDDKRGARKITVSRYNDIKTRLLTLYERAREIEEA